MNKRSGKHALTVLVCFGLCAIAQAQDSYTDIHCGQLLDVENRKVLRNQHILVRNDTIAAIGRSVNAPASAVTVDLSSQTCAPGFMDMHVHLFLDATKATLDIGRVTNSSAYNTLLGLRNAQTLLDLGFTTIRMTGDYDEYFASIELRNAINRGEFTGPRMLVAPHPLSPLGGHGDTNSYAADAGINERSNIVDGPDEARRAVRREIKYGADWIKIMASGGVMSQHDDPTVAAYTQAEFDAFADETHRHKKRITAHAHGDDGIRMAVEAGFDSIEHATMMSEGTARLMAEKGTFYVPTLYVLDWILEIGRNGGITADNYAKAQLVATMHSKSVKLALDHGIKMVLGSDPIFPMHEAIREFASMSKRIPDNWYVLQAATVNAAEMAGMSDEIGSLSVGKQADIVAMPGNPVDDMSQVEQVSFIMKGGYVVRD